jgi:tol-pal system protein YbgF
MQHVRSVWCNAAMALTLGLAVLSSPAQAALFGGDDEARRAILDLRQRLEQSQNATRALIEQNAQLQSQTQNQATAQLRSALLDLQGQIDRLKSELAQSLGAQERLARDLTELQLRQKDVLISVDDRLRRFEPVPATIDGREVMVDPAEKADHDKAMALFRQADFAAAQGALESFVLRHAASAYVPSALFWLGNAQYANKAYKESMANFQKLLSMAPNHPRAAESMLAISNVQIELKDMKAARKTLEDLIVAYPLAETAGTARERLGRLR